MGLRQNESEKLGPQIAQYRAQLAAVNQALGGEHVRCGSAWVFTCASLIFACYCLGANV